MCTILLAWRCVPGVDLVVAATRDEFFGRPASEPAVLRESPRIVGGFDLRTRGTWMAVAADGRLATVTNRYCDSIDPRRRSRGELPLAVLEQQEEMTRPFLVQLRPGEYNPFNILYVSPTHALVGHGDAANALRIIELTPGPHVLTLRDVDQHDDPKTAFLFAGLEKTLQAGTDSHWVLAEMETLLAEHGDDRRCDMDATCVHGNGYGTVSATSFMIGQDTLVYRHAGGPPCRTPWRDWSDLFYGSGTASML